MREVTINQVDSGPISSAESNWNFIWSKEFATKLLYSYSDHTGNVLIKSNKVKLYKYVRLKGTV